jgi:hypothetical protein
MPGADTKKLNRAHRRDTPQLSLNDGHIKLSRLFVRPTAAEIAG